MVEEIYKLNKTLFLEEQKNKEIVKNGKNLRAKSLTLVDFYSIFLIKSLAIRPSASKNEAGLIKKASVCSSLI